MGNLSKEEIENFVSKQIDELLDVSDDNLLAISHNLISIANEEISREEKDEKVKEQFVHLFREILLASNTLNVRVQSMVLRS